MKKFRAGYPGGGKTAEQHVEKKPKNRRIHWHTSKKAEKIDVSYAKQGCCGRGHKKKSVAVLKDEGFPNAGEWKVLQRIIDRIQPAFLGTILGGFRSFKNTIDLRILEQMLRDRNFSAVENLVPFQGFLDTEKLDQIYSGALLQSARSSQEFFKRTVARIIPTINPSGFNVNVSNPRVNRYILTRVGSLVRGVTVESQRSIQQAITSSISEGLTPRAAARVIRNSIGLTPQQTSAVARFQAKLEQNDFSSLTPFQRDSLMRSRRGAAVNRDFLEQLSPERVDRLTEQYANRQLLSRATTIARNEVAETANFGQREVWEQAADEGIFDRNGSRKKWIVTPDDRLCPICEPMAGVEIPYNENFNLPNGESKPGPNAHINCRCALTLIFPEERGIR